MSINIKKYTKDQMAKMVEDAQAANTELERQVAALGDRIDKQNDTLSEYANKNMNLRADISALRVKLTDTEKTLGRVNADLAHQIEVNRTLTIELHREGERVKAMAVKLANCEADLKWAQEHPWKHLWACLKGAGND